MTTQKRLPYFTKKQISELNSEELGFLYTLKSTPVDNKYGNQYLYLRNSYNNMFNRCKYNKNYKNVEVCTEWGKSSSKGFYNFAYWAVEQGFFSQELTLPVIARIHDLGGYSPERCEVIEKVQNTKDALCKAYKVTWLNCGITEVITDLKAFTKSYNLNRNTVYNYARKGKLCSLLADYEPFYIKQI